MKIGFIGRGNTKALSIAMAIIIQELSIDADECDNTPCCDDSYDDGTQHWRGGSRGKGGKIKYKRG